MKTKKIGDLLLEKEYITQDELDEALEEQKTSGKRVGEILIDKGVISEDHLIEAISIRLSIPKISLGSMVLDPIVVQKVPVNIARRYNLIPIFAIGNTLSIAMADPLNIIAIDELKYVTKLNIQRSIAPSSEIKQAIDKYYSVADSLNQYIDTKKKDSAYEEISKKKAEDNSDSPIIKLVNVLISKAVNDHASDIHIEPEENQIRIRYRISGVMHEEAAPPKSMQSELISRIKVASNLDVSEKRLPQDGRFMYNFDGLTVDLRVSTLPTIHGEKIVIRILDRRNLKLNFKQLGFDNKLIERWKNIINKPEGLILISGPTSSGKTSTLYTSLQDINSIDKNIVTIEDPVEYSLPLIIQTQINEKAGLTFPKILRSLLRQNPDIMMIGEIRDSETAQLAIRASFTGHLVFSTIHTNDAPSTLSRLMNMGIEPYLIASTVKGVLAQRLIRLNCPDCLEEYRPSEPVLAKAGLYDLSEAFTFKKGQGCAKCKNTGFAGMTGIYEYLEINSEISELITNNASVSKIKEAARKNGFLTLFEIGLGKIQEGKISLEELLKETSNIEEYVEPQNKKVPVENAYVV
ncbi:MAG: ATPase, T2SS/T4P/T4SS family [candidate division Zixibacteria bacterium]|nr:ATPase, T2SS/T4P/T4SS family [candidate division Zixibacteria bacterium]